jgi:hypothetical protein
MGFEDQANEQPRGFPGAATSAITPTGSSGASNLVLLFIGSDGRTAKKEQDEEEAKVGSVFADLINYGFSQVVFHACAVNAKAILTTPGGRWDFR